MTMRLTIDHRDGTKRPCDCDVTGAYNFGYAGRTREAVQAHIDELVHLGLTPPTRVPSIYVMRPGAVTTASEVTVAGSTSYGEVEFALIRTAAGWLVAAASDHSEFAVESASTAYAKIMYPNVVSGVVWMHDEIREHWDELTLTAECRRLSGDGSAWQRVQHGSVAELLRPDDLIAELTHRVGSPLPVGTVILSGTIGGDIATGASSWRCRLTDPVLDRTLEVRYDVVGEPQEI